MSCTLDIVALINNLQISLSFGAGLFITARKRSFVQGNIFAPVYHSVHGGGVPAPGGVWGVPAWGGGGYAPGPHPRGKLRVIRSRPTPKGEIEGGQIQAHTQEGN